MINQLQNLKQQICYRHNQPITFFQQGQPMCSICISQQKGMMTIEQFYQQLEEISFKENQEKQQQHQLLQSVWDSLVSYQTNINKHLEKILKVIQDQIGMIETQSQQSQSLIQECNNQQKLTGELEKELTYTSESNQSVRGLIEKMLIDFKQKQCQIDPIIELLKSNPVQEIQAIVDVVERPKKIISQEVQKEHQDILNRFEYQIIKENSVKGYGCYAFAFNRDNNILAVASDKVIIVYEFYNGKLSKELQRLEGHTKQIYYLYFIKQSNGIVSGSDDKSIIIWDLNENKQYFARQILKGHEHYVSCLLMNKKEDLLISGSWDRTIKFCRVQNGSWNSVQTFETSAYVNLLSLNDMENKLISCSYGSYILVYEIQQSDQQWVLVQTIETSICGLRLCFTIGDQFVFQPETLDYLEVYNYDNLKKQFYKLKQIQIQNCEKCCTGFPCQFIQQLSILTVKHGNYLNIFRLHKDGDDQLIQTIEFKDFRLYGRMTDDGKYLVIWCKDQDEIQIRKLIQLE